MESKVCSKCGESFPLTPEYWHRNKNQKDGFNLHCKKCVAQYYKDNKTCNSEGNMKICRRCGKYLPHTSEFFKRDIKIKKSGFSSVCKKCCSMDQKEYYKKHKRKINKSTIKYNSDTLICTHHKIFDSIKSYEDIYITEENIPLFLCAYCGKRFRPKRSSVDIRLRTINGEYSGESRLYCSEECKTSCPTYKTSKYPKGFKLNTSREVDPQIRQMCFERDNWECQKCGANNRDTIEGQDGVQLHCHHIKGYAQNKILANDIDNVITLCKECHNEVHRQDGCKYHELRCTPENN